MRSNGIKRGQLTALEVILWVICLLILVFVINEYLDIIGLDPIMLIFGQLQSIIY